MTGKYFELWVKDNASGNNYLNVYRDFCALSDANDASCVLENACKPDNESLYRALRAWQEPQKAVFPIEVYGVVSKKFEKLSRIESAAQMPDLEFLRDLDIDILHPDRNPGGKANQKWHLYVCVFAYRVVCESGFCARDGWDKDFPKYRCRPLRLWMIENAGGQERVLKTIENALAGETVTAEAWKEINKLIDDTFDRIVGEA